MALTRRALSTMGLDDNQVEQIIEMHTEVTDSLKDERDQYKAEAEKLTAVQKELDELKEATKNGEKSPYKAKYEAAVNEKEALQKEFDLYKTEQTKRENHSKKEKAFKAILKDAGVPERHYAKVLKYSDVDGIELDDDGKVKSADEILKSIKSEWADHIESTETVGAKVETPPANTGGKAEQPSRAAMLAQKYHADKYGKEEK